MISIVESLGKKGKREYTGGADTCVCPKCGEEVPHKRGIPCNTIKCPKCKIPMTGKGAKGEVRNN